MHREPLEPRRVRYPRGAYGWIDLKIVTGGFLERLGPDTALTYLFLCAVGNAQGISFWSLQRMARTLGLSSDKVQAALNELQDEDLIASNGRIVQVLALAERPGGTPAAGQTATASAGQVGSTPQNASVVDQTRPEPEVDEDSIRASEPEAQAQLALIFGSQQPSSSLVRNVAKSIALTAGYGGREARGEGRGRRG